MEAENHTTHSEEETIKLGFDFARNLAEGDIVALYGDLGSGKTEFIKGICKYLKVDDFITSPTFTIINQYHGNLDDKDISIYHIDLYRIKSDKELEDIGFSDCVYSDNAIKLIEWPEKSHGALPKNGFSVRIDTDNNDEDLRRISIERLNNHTPKLPEE